MSTWLQQAALWTWQNSLAAAALAAVIIGMRHMFRGKIAPLWLCVAGWLVMVRLWLPAPLHHAWAWDRAWTATHGAVKKESSPGREPSPPLMPARESSIEELNAELAAARAQLNGMALSDPDARDASSIASTLEIDDAEELFTPTLAPPAPVAATPVDWIMIGSWLWISGTIFSLCWTFICHARFVRRLNRAVQPLDLPWQGVVAQCAATAGLRRAPALFTVPGNGSPFLCGLFHPRIILPAGTLERLSRDEARHVLLHEMLHIRRRDLAANWLLAVARSLHWFNPFVHFICRRLLADRELLRDHQAIALLRDPSARTAYSRTLLKLALPSSAPAPSPGLAPLFRSEKELKRRITMIQSPLHRHRLAATLSTIALGALSTVIFTTARAQEKPAPESPPPALPAAPSSAAAPALPDAPKPPAPPSPPDQPSPASAAAVEPSPTQTTAAPDKIEAKPAKTLKSKSGASVELKPGKIAILKGPDNQAMEDLRTVAASLRANGQTKEADVIEEALKRFPVPPKIEATELKQVRAALSSMPATEMQQLRAEMAEIKATLAKLKVLSTSDLEGDLEQLRRLKINHLKDGLTGGLGRKHPKIEVLQNDLREMESRLEAAKKTESGRGDKIRELEKAGAANADLKRELERHASLMKEKQAVATEKAAVIKREIEKATKDIIDSQAAENKARAESMKVEALKRYQDALKYKDDAKAAAEESKVRRAEGVKDTDQAGDNLPWGVAVTGKQGLVYSPYTPEHSIVDVAGFKKGSKVTCPYTNNFFRVP